MDARRFFTVAVPSIVARDFEQFMTLNGVIACKVKGEGAWTVRFGDVETPIADGFDPRADLKIWFTQEGFDALVNGNGNMRKIVMQGEIAFAGDASYLERLGFLMSPGGSPLATRMGNF